MNIENLNEDEPRDEAHGWITITLSFGPESSINGCAINPLDVLKHEVYPILEKQISTYVLEHEYNTLLDCSSIKVGLGVLNKNGGSIFTILVATELNDTPSILALSTNTMEIEGTYVDRKKLPPELEELTKLEQKGGTVIGVTTSGQEHDTYTFWGEDKTSLSDALDSFFKKNQQLLEAAARPKTTTDSVIRGLLPKQDAKRLLDPKGYIASDLLNTSSD